jgi:hypothetical protein
MAKAQPSQTLVSKALFSDLIVCHHLRSRLRWIAFEPGHTKTGR